MMNKFPADVISNIKAYACDIYKPTPTAQLIKTLNFEYKQTSHTGGIFRPYRLEENTNDGYFNWMNFTSPLNADIWSIPIRQYIISDLLPSYWSFYANTMDRNING